MPYGRRTIKDDPSTVIPCCCCSMLTMNRFHSSSPRISEGSDGKYSSIPVTLKSRTITNSSEAALHMSSRPVQPPYCGCIKPASNSLYRARLSIGSTIRRVVSYFALCLPGLCLRVACRPATCHQAMSRRARSYWEVFHPGLSPPEGFHQATCRRAASRPAMCRRPAYCQVRSALSPHQPFLNVSYRACCLA